MNSSDRKYNMGVDAEFMDAMMAVMLGATQELRRGFGPVNEDQSEWYVSWGVDEIEIKMRGFESYEEARDFSNRFFGNEASAVVDWSFVREMFTGARKLYAIRDKARAARKESNHE